MSTPNLNNYSKFIIAWSGGVDSLACILHLLELGVGRNQIELWHHLIDGREGDSFMDWPCTPGYARAVAIALGVEYYESWKVKGFRGEMLKENSRTLPTRFEVPDGRVLQSGGIIGKPGTRRLFPQVTAKLAQRWCSSVLKIDIMSAALRNQPRFNYTKTLVITGERADESVARAHYETFEPHRADLRGGRHVWRWIDHWRPIHEWSKMDCWRIAERWKINPHPCYRLGFGRCSCMFCIFANPQQYASAAELDPVRFAELIAYEAEFGKTIKRHASLFDFTKGIATYENMKQVDIDAALSHNWREPIIMDKWVLPSGATASLDGPQ